MEAWVGCALWATRLDMVGNAHPTKALSHGIFYGNAIAFAIRSFDPSIYIVCLIPIYATELFRMRSVFVSVIIWRKHSPF